MAYHYNPADFQSVGTIAYYQINKAYITRVFCENRDKPQRHCNGQCYLAKKLKEQQESQDERTSEQVQNIPFLQLFAIPLASFDFLSTDFSQSQEREFLYRLATYQAPLSILVPPPCA